MAKTSIQKVIARKIIDGMGRATIELEIETESGYAVAAPSLAHPRTQGQFEIIHYPKGGVDEAIEIIRKKIVPKLIGQDAADQTTIDRMLKQLDGTPNFSTIGGNTAEVVSTCVAKVAASSFGIPLFLYLGPPFSIKIPNLLINIIGGGPTSGGEFWRGRTPDIQEHNIIPVGAKSITESILTAIKVHERVGELSGEIDPYYTGGRDFEYSWVPSITDREALDILHKACGEVEKETGVRIRMGIDVAGEDLWQPDEKVYFHKKENVKRTRSQEFDFIANLIESYDLYYIEDPFTDNDFELHHELTKQFGSKCLIVGDDLFATNPERLKKGIDMGAANAAIVKVNMIGTLTDAYEFIQLAKKNNIATIISPRTGDTCDTTLSHLGVGWQVDLLKTGGALGGERIAKVNELIRIEEALGNRCSMFQFEPSCRL